MLTELTGTSSRGELTGLPDMIHKATGSTFAFTSVEGKRHPWAPCASVHATSAGESEVSELIGRLR